MKLPERNGDRLSRQVSGEDGRDHAPRIHRLGFADARPPHGAALVRPRAASPTIWFPTSQGRFYQNEDFGLVGAVADHVEAGRSRSAASTASTPRASTRRRRPGRSDPPARPVRPYLYTEVVPFARSKARWPGRMALWAAPSARTTRPTSDSAIPTSSTRSSASPASTTSTLPRRLLGRALLLPLPDGVRSEHGPEWVARLSSMDIAS